MPAGVCAELNAESQARGFFEHFLILARFRSALLDARYLLCVLHWSTRPSAIVIVPFHALQSSCMVALLLRCDVIT